MSSAMLHTNDDFLNAIRAEPHERTLRLLYADWLDEHEDPRGELIRTEEEMRQVPVFADRFWELKPRRNELRTTAGTEWCALMKYGTECEPVFRHGIPDGWRERWRLIREFTERWYRVPMPDIGGRQAEIAEAEARLGRKLPPSVREWVAFAHDANMRPNHPIYLHVFRELYEMENVPDHPALSLLRQYEDGYAWAVHHNTLDDPDPPVHGYGFEFENGMATTCSPDTERNPLATTVTEFTLGTALTYMKGHVSGDWVSTTSADPASVLNELAATFPPPTRFGHYNIYEAENIMVLASPEIRRSGTWFEMRIFKPLTREQMPASLWRYSSNGRASHQLTERSILPPAGPNDPIPF
ncbi:TIGR02996 domain-containing protein [Gemmata sp. G18]|uniref:TIGR02996 domain-containing protein n=1 Tax=Gemmata palustris TaxID=2822762 RepID=A0ABS5C0M8_9BACT|nr:TIGR02996 domain-containing protein [Gemmata palustris]MBP3959542.1 TIGR02996 domain-containing protein [Gemmata palustris]